MHQPESSFPVWPAAKVYIQWVAGMTVNMHTSRGRPTRRRRCPPNAFSPRRCHSIAVKKPLSMKNTGIRNP